MTHLILLGLFLIQSFQGLVNQFVKAETAYGFEDKGSKERKNSPLDIELTEGIEKSDSDEVGFLPMDFPAFLSFGSHSPIEYRPFAHLASSNEASLCQRVPLFIWFQVFRI